MSAPLVVLLYDRTFQETTFNWWAPGSEAVDVYRGVIGSGGGRGTLSLPFYDLDTAPGPAACFIANVAGTPVPPGSNGTFGPLSQAQDPDPAVGFATYYVLSRNAPGGGSLNAMGCAAPGLCADTPALACGSDADCGSGICLTHSGVALPAGPQIGPLGCPAPGDPARLIRRVDPGNLCP